MVMKKRIFLISHGRLAEGMANALGMLVGDIGELQTFGLMPGEAPETIAFAIEQVILQNPEDRVCVVADLLCGSVSNAATRLVQYPNVRMFNGMNLAFVTSLSFAGAEVSDEELEEMLAEARGGLSMVKPVDLAETADEDDIL